MLINMDISRLKLIAFARDGGPRFSRVALSTVTVLLCLFAAKAYSQPVNDNFANATLITGSTGTVFGTTFSATREAGEPIHAGVAGGHSVWYSWVAPDTGTATFDTFGSTYDTVLAAYTGTGISNLVVLAANDDFFNLQSRISFDVTAGNSYNIVVDGYRGSQGSYRL